MNKVNVKNLYPLGILRGATHLGMQMLLHLHERRKKPVDIMDLSSKVRCTCCLLAKLNDCQKLLRTYLPPETASLALIAQDLAF